MRIYMAPLEGVTDSIFRNNQKKYFGGVDKYFTPFISPNHTYSFTGKEKRNIDPLHNDLATTVPQIMTANSEHFNWAANELHKMGYQEINLNLGCPSMTVVTKKKGSGFLAYPDELKAFLYEIFDNANKEGFDISVKTRLGKNSPEEFYRILEIYNEFPICELTVHPRIQKDFYKEDVKREYFDYAAKNSSNSLVYNGDIFSVEDYNQIASEYENINAVMLGRGLIGNPDLANNVRGNKTADFYRVFNDFHDSLLIEYKEAFSGDLPVIHHLKEMWFYWQNLFPGSDKLVKELLKSKKMANYELVSREIIQKFI